MKKAIVVVDMQNDFVDGALGTAEAQAMLPRTRIRPSADSRARMRWLAAEGEMPRRAAAASKVPVSAMASRVANWSGCMKGCFIY